MKQLILALTLIFTTSIFAQKIDYNEQKGFVASGYDVVAYFSNKVVKGSSKFTYAFDGASYKFSSKENLDTFKSNTAKFIPQYGGYCAYAMGKNGEKVTVNPKTFEIRDGKLYLFYNSWGTDTLEKWLKEGPSTLQKKADKAWETQKFKS